MSGKVTIYPAIDLRQGRCVRLRQGRPQEETVFGDDPLVVARRWADEGAEWLHVVNLDGAFGQKSPNVRILGDIVAAVDIPVQFGGGLRDITGIEEALSLGVQRIILGTVAVRHPALVACALERFGPQKVAVGIDAREGQVATNGWQNVSSVTALELALKMKELGLSRVVHTDIARDGMLCGVNVEASAELARRTGLMVIASGGISSLEDVRRVKEAHLEGVIIGQALYTGAVALPQAIKVGRE